MERSATTDQLTRPWTPVTTLLSPTIPSAGDHRLQTRRQPSSMQDLVGGKKNCMLKSKPRDIADIVKEPSQADIDGSALVLSHATLGHQTFRRGQAIFPAARLSYLNPGNVQRPYEITSPAPGIEPEAKGSGSSINNLLSEYAETISSDSERENMPLKAPQDDVPVATSDILMPETKKKRVSAQANEWSSDDSDDEKDVDYTPSAEDATILTGAASVTRDAHNARRREKYWVKKQQETLRLRREAGKYRSEKHELDGAEDSERPSKVVKLNLSPKGKGKALVENTSAKAEFPKGKRVVKKDGYSQTPNAIDYRARKAYQKELEEQFRKSLDQDIVRQVEAEGWITPEGRLYKAGLRQMQRVTQEREAADAADHRTMELTFEGQQRKVQTLEAENEKLRSGVEEMRQVLNKLDLGE